MAILDNLNVKNGEVKYVQVKSAIKKWILSGKIGTNEKIPSENKLVESFEVSRHTIRQAISELVNEGWLRKEQGKGTFVCLGNSGLDGDASRGEGLRIGVIVTYLTDYIFPHIVSGIEAFVSERGHTLSLFSTSNDMSTERRCLETVLARGLDGLIIEPTRSTLPNQNIDLYLLLQQQNIPFVMLHSSYTELNPSMVALDDFRGAYMATEHLIQLGHRKIAGIFKSDDMQGRNRFRGFVKAHQDYKVQLDSRMISTFVTEERNLIGPSFIKGVFGNGIEAANQVEKINVENVARPSAIVCYNDELAIQVVSTLRSLGLSVPGDVSVTGFDDSSLATIGDVGLTSVTHPKDKMGEMAARLLLSINEDRENMWVPREHLFQPELIVRGSTAEPK